MATDYVPHGDGFSSKDSATSSVTHTKSSHYTTISSKGNDFDGHDEEEFRPLAAKQLRQSEMESNITPRTKEM